MTGEALESAHKKFISDYQDSVSGVDTDYDFNYKYSNFFSLLVVWNIYDVAKGYGRLSQTIVINKV